MQYVKGSWFECAGYNDCVPPSPNEIERWLITLMTNPDLQSDVARRFALTRGKRKFESWMKASFFFKNFTNEQRIIVQRLVIKHNFGG